MTEFAIEIPGFQISRLTEAQIDEVLALMNLEGWYYYDQRELRRYLKLNQECFTMLKERHVVAAVFTTDFGNQAWFGNIIVAEAFRGMGLASRLIQDVMRRLFEYRNIRTFRLGAVPLAIGLYQKLGFHAEGFTTAQEVALPLKAEFVTAELDEKVSLMPMSEADLPAVAQLDAACFQSDRLSLLTALFDDSVRGSCVCLKEQERVVGFLMIRRRQASKSEAHFAEGPDYVYRLGPCSVLPEYGVDGFKAMFQYAMAAVNEQVAQHGGSATMYVVFPRNADKADIYRDTQELAMGMSLDVESVFDEHAEIFAARASAKNDKQWQYMKAMGFHQEYFEQVMCCYLDETGAPCSSPEMASLTRADTESLFASATPGDKA